MGEEIERKFLVKSEFQPDVNGSCIRQGYLNSEKERTVRVRIADDEGFITIKGINIQGVNKEFEYRIPLEDANQMLDNLCKKPLIEKTRYRISYAKLIWDIDIFQGDNEGLAIAEIELSDKNQEVELPPWIGDEVTGNPRYFNSYLIEHPYSKWD